MTTITKLAHCVADALEVPRHSVGSYATTLRKAGLLSAGKEVATAESAANLLLSILGGGSPQDASRAAHNLSGMRFVDAYSRHVTPDKETRESYLQYLLDTSDGVLPDHLLGTFGQLIAAFIRDYQEGEHRKFEQRPTRLTISQRRPLAILEINAHPSFLGGALMAEYQFAGPVDGDTMGLLQSGTWPPDIPNSLSGLERFAVVPGDVFEALADVLNEAEAPKLQPEQAAQLSTRGA